MVFLRKVRTGSGATAVQIARREGRRDVIVEHLGSARSGAELAVLMEAGRQKLHAGQAELDFGWSTQGAGATILGQSSVLLVGVIQAAWQALGFDQLGDDAFFQLVLARVVEPTSKTDSVRVLAELGVSPAHRNTFYAALRRCAERSYRDRIAEACFRYAKTAGDVSLVLYDVTTLYFEAEHEDTLRKVGFSNYAVVSVMPRVVVLVLFRAVGWGCGRGISGRGQGVIVVPGSR